MDISAQEVQHAVPEFDVGVTLERVKFSTQAPHKPGIYAWVPREGQPALVRVDNNGYTQTLDSSDYYERTPLKEWPFKHWYATSRSDLIIWVPHAGAPTILRVFDGRVVGRGHSYVQVLPSTQIYAGLRVTAWGEGQWILLREE